LALIFAINPFGLALPSLLLSCTFFATSFAGKNAHSFLLDALFRRGGKPGVLTVGGSQMGNMEKEMGKKGGEVVEMRGWVEIKGEWNEDEWEG
jgi:hypothetical protein